MLRFAVLIVLVASVLAGGNYGGSYGGGYGGGSYGKSFGGSYGKSFGGSYGKSYGQSSYGGGNIQAAVISRRQVQFVDVPSNYEAAQPLNIEVGSEGSPINFLFRSKSSPINLQSAHEPSPGSYQETSSQDEPHVLVHTVTRPVVNELREIITPYRRVKQEIQPVQESVETLVSKGSQGYSSGYAQPSYGGYNQGGYSQGGYSQGGYGQGGYGQAAFTQGGYGQQQGDY